MSGPMSNLKKQRKTPLSSHGVDEHKWVPYRPASYTDDEAKLLDEIAGQMAGSKLKEARSPGMSGDSFVGGVSKKKAGLTPRVDNTNMTPKGSAPSDQQLMSLMMTRVTQMENRLQHQTKEIIEKDKIIRVLEDKIRILRKAQEAEDGAPGRIRQLEQKCLLLQQQVYDMELFLADYGMVWVGEKSDPEADVYNDDKIVEEELQKLEEKESRLSDRPDLLERPESTIDMEGQWHPASSVPTSDFQVDYDIAIKNLKDLNELAGEGIAQIQRTTDGARLKMPDPINLALYSNGIVLFSGPFRPFSDPTTQHFMKDILDGYFPSELQKRYPDGVPFIVSDKRSVYFRNTRASVFQGTGQTLGGDERPSRLVPSNLDRSSKTSRLFPDTDSKSSVKDQASSTEGLNEGNKDGLEETSELPGPKMSMEQFLNRLPQNVIKNSRVVSVRDGIAETLQGGKPQASGVTVVDTPAVQEMKHRMEQTESERQPSARDVTTLRVKSETGDHTYILRMKFTDTISDVYLYIDKQRGKLPKTYKIMSTFPTRTFDDRLSRETLQDCGLVPSATLHLKNTK